MFGRLLKSKFYSKCKSVIKVAKTRIETIQRRRNAMQKFFKTDIVDLLKNGLDYHAYGRAEGLLIEMTLTSCYDFLQQSCECISTHLSAMNLHKECPEECREAVASLIFAAARFADLPELRELRSIFTERYGDSLETYINKEFVEKLKLKHPTKDMKLQLIQDIAEENGIEWDSKSLEQKLYKPPPSEQDMSKNSTDVDDKSKIHKSNEKSAWKIDDHEDLSLFKTSSKKEVDDNKKHVDYKSIPPPYHIKPEISTDETSSEAFSTSSKSNELVQAYKPKAKSIRRRRGKSISAHNDIDSTCKGNVVRKTNSSVSEQEQKRGLKMLASNSDDQWDEQEKMDRLLEYCSTKMPPHLQQEDGDPTEATKQAHDTEFQHGTLKTSGHVHPKLPDYDDLAARFAALKGK
ncbi:hypothetical protein LguiA_028656 [Lonicera macranthoides]